MFFCHIIICFLCEQRQLVFLHISFKIMVYQFVMASYVQRTREILSNALVGRQGRNNILELTTSMWRFLLTSLWIWLINLAVQFVLLLLLYGNREFLHGFTQSCYIIVWFYYRLEYTVWKRIKGLVLWSMSECYRKTYSFDQTCTLRFLGIWTEISLAEEGGKI